MLHEVSSSRPWLILIDDTDILDTRGTGYRARILLAALEDASLVQAVGITRHQLQVDDRIPYTSHNSSACLQVLSPAPAPELMAFCGEFMLAEAAEGSDVGLCLATPSQGRAVAAYGRKAKQEVLNQDFARGEPGTV